MKTIKKLSWSVAVALCTGTAASSGTSLPATSSGATMSGWTASPAGYAPKPLPASPYPNTTNQATRTQRPVFQPEPGLSGQHTYIVELTDPAAAVYQGSLAKLPATADLIRQQLQQSKRPLAMSAGPLAKYSRYLQQQQLQLVDRALHEQGLQLEVDRSFQLTLNGFTTRLTQDEAARLAQVKGVRQISRSKLRQLFTHQTAGQTGAHKVWQQAQGGLGSTMGEGMVIGVMDTGINTDHPSFAAVGGDGYRHINPLGQRYLGDCATVAGLCNDKLIGVYSYAEITAAYSDPVFAESRPAYGEDYHSHGSHVAGTAAGNVLRELPFLLPDIQPTSDGIATGLILPQVSGMAPHANIIAYQVCFPGSSGDPYSGCPTSAILAAVEQSVLDNVDVINLSLGGQEENPWTDPMEQAFLHAAKAGVMVVTAAGNNGDQLYTADHSSPWVTTVAAHTPANRLITEPKTLTDLQGGDSPAPDAISGFSTTFTPVSGWIVKAADYAADPTDPAAADCDQPFAAGTFVLPDDVSTVGVDESQRPVLVLCQRSQQPLYAKSQHVQQGGGAGIIIMNQSEEADFGRIPEIPHAIPGIHIRYDDAQPLLQWLATGRGHRGTLTGTPVLSVPAGSEKIAGFSSRGPSYFKLDTLLVDIAAPGVDVYAPAADDQPFTAQPGASDWTTMSGTSMASPHVAGAALLLRQSHPAWSPLQVQSALLMTASNSLEKGSVFDPYLSNDERAEMQDMGAGRLNVDIADQVDLTLHEDVTRMAEADPAQGGQLTRLNTAYLVNNHCGQQCSFVRTFTAERAGSWQLSVAGATNDTDISVEPAEFSLQAGEQQAVLVTVRHKTTTTASPVPDTKGAQAYLRISPQQAAPELELPIWTWSGERGLPAHTLIEAHRSSGTLKVGPFDTPEVNALTPRSYGLVKASKTEKRLYTDLTGHDPYDVAADGQNPNLLHWQDVPAQSKALMSRVSGTDTSRVMLFTGHDANNNGQADADEVLCMSTSSEQVNFCSIEQPLAGKYWTLLMSLADVPYGSEDQGRIIELATAVVPAQDSGNLKISSGQPIPGYQRYQLELKYQLSGLTQGELYFGGYDLGTDANNPGNLGYVPLTLSRIRDDVTFTASQRQAKPGDTVKYQLSVIANTEAEAKNFSFAAKFPVGLQLIADSVKASHATPAAVTISNNTVQLAGVQPSTRDVARNYRVTTNQNDPRCSLDAVNAPQPGYLDLRSLGWRTLEGVSGDHTQAAEFSLSQLMATDAKITFPFFGNRAYDRIQINPAGVLHFGSRPLPDSHLKLPEALSWMPLPEDMIAPLWVGDQHFSRFDAPYDQLELNAGVTSTYTVDRQWLVLEYDNVTRRDAPGQLADFEVFLRMLINDEPGEYEMLFAYDNLQLADQAGSVGFKQYAGYVIVDGDIPLDVSTGQGIAYNNVGSVLADKRVICMDYTGPEQSKFELSFSAYVSEQAAGTTATVELANGLQGSETESIRLSLPVTGNLQLLPLADLQVQENTPVSFTVRYQDSNRVSNLIKVSAEQVTAQISGQQSGAMVSLTPAKNFHGKTKVTVTVSDSVNPTDQTRGEFWLTVLSDGVEPGCNDAKASNFNPQATSNDGSCRYPELPPAAKKSSGAWHWPGLILLGWLAWRRRRLA